MLGVSASVMKVTCRMKHKPSEWLPPAEIANTYRRRFWRVLMDFVIGRWLKANGWIQVKDGWLLPPWHPKLLRLKAKVPNFASPVRGPWFQTEARGPIVGLNEPYDLYHAANSQRAHTVRRAVQCSPTQRHKAPAFPSYVRVKPFQAVLNTLLFLAVSFQISLMGHWTSYLFSLVACLVFCVSLLISWKTRREWELEWAESQLRGRNDGIHSGN